MNSKTPCPCGSQVNYLQCCGACIELQQMLWVVAQHIVKTIPRKRMRKVLKPLVVSLCYVSSALAGWSADVGFTSNDIWRGLTQSDNKPSVQTNLNYAFDNGFYAGLAAANVNFGEGEDLELDPTIGYAGKLANGMGYDIGLIRYHYFKAEESSFNEAQVKISYSIFHAGIAYTDDYSGTNTEGIYYTAGIVYEIPEGIVNGVTVSANMGHQQLDSEIGSSYNDYRLAISKQLTKNVSMEVAYTTLSCNEDCDVPGGKNHLLGTITASFG